MNTMNNKTDNNALNDLFRKLPEEELPPLFRENMMQKIMREAVRIKKRNERLALLAVIAASLVMVTLAVLAFIYMELPVLKFSFSISHLSTLPSVPFYVYIGILSLLLLFGDYKIRKVYKGKNKK